MDDTKREILDIAVAFIKENKRYPSVTDMGKLGVTRESIRHHFDNATTLKMDAYAVSKEYIFDLEQEKNFKKPKKSTKRFVISTAVVGSEVDFNFYKNIKAYCKDEDAELIVLPSVPGGNPGLTLDPILRDDVILIDDFELNDNIFVLGVKNNAKSADPITGFPRVGRRNGTFISASPKQRLKYVATGIDKLAHALMSTGAITLPNYPSKGLLTEKSSYMAEQDHVMGAIILELDKDSTFHFRQIQADRNGTFVDLGTIYRGGRRARMAPAAFVLGDWHSGETDPVVAACWKDVTAKLKVPSWVIHDGFSGTCVNHHLLGKFATLAKMADEKLLSLKEELDGYAKDLTMMSKMLDEVVIVKSNHDDFLERYLNEGRYVTDAQNHRLALELAAAFIDGHNPIKFYMEEILKLKLNNVRWLERDEDYAIADIQCGAHGDEGANGARGSANSLENAYGDVVSGHSHTPQILRGSWVVGTTSYLKLSYNSGPSSWFHTSCLIYPNGHRQLINSIDGRWTTRKL